MNTRGKKRIFNVAVIFALIFSLFVPFQNVSKAADAITVANAIANNTGNATVVGYIVGFASGANAITQDPSKFANDFNYAIADSPSETNKAKMLDVQIAANYRPTHGLQTNPGNIGKKVMVTGTLGAYNSMPGLKSPTSMEFVDGTTPTEPTKVSAVQATPTPGAVPAGTAVALNTATVGATIYYTTDGSAPTTASARYTDPIVINAATTFKAFAVKDGLDNSDVATFAYTIQVDNGAPRIFDIQGKSHTSPYNGKTVTDVEGVVTYIDGTSRFYMQDLVGDGDNDTSDGILVFKSSHGVSIGDRVKVTGKVDEFVGEGFTEKATTDLTITEIAATSITKNGTAALPKPIKLGVDRIAPPEVVDNDQFALFDPEEDAIDFWESIEGMYVQVDDAKVIAPEKDALVWVVPKDYPTNVNPQGLRITATDTNPDRIAVDVRNGATANKSYKAKMGDYFTGSIKGIISYGYSNFKLMTQENTLPTLNEVPIVRNATKIVPANDKLMIASYNVENFSTATPDAKVTKIGDAIVNKMKNPDIIGLTEVQDNSGETDNGIVDGTQSAQKIIDKVKSLGGPTYKYTEIVPVNNQDGGAPGGNIRVAFLYNPERVSLTAGAPKGTSTQAVGFENGKLTLNPGRIDPTNSAFNSSRKPLAAQFDFQGQTIVVIANHFNSKSGDQPIFGKNQPPVLKSEIQRHKIAAIVNNFVKDVKTKDPNANVVLMGDFNDFEFTKTFEILKGNELTNMIELVPEQDRYSYSYNGNAQVLDHMLVSKNMVANTAVEILHINSGFMEVHGRASDHDPTIIQTQLKAKEVLPPVTPPASTKVYNLTGFKTKKLTVSNEGADITVDATSVITDGIVLKGSYAKLSGLANTAVTISPAAAGAYVDFGGQSVKEVVIDNSNISQIRGIENVQKWTASQGVDVSNIKFTNAAGEVVAPPTMNVPKVNQAPVIKKAISDVSVQAGTPVSIDLFQYFSDPDGDALTFTASTGELEGSILTLPTGTEGTVKITVTATDGKSTVTLSFNLTVSALVTPPANETDTYYSSAIGKSGSALKLALHDIIKVQKKLSYAQVTEALKLTDEDPNNPNNVILLYTGRSQAKTTFGSGVNDWNREHVWAKSHGNFGTSIGPGTDIHHLRPTDASVNSTRGSKDFDNGGTSIGAECPLCLTDSDSFEPPTRVKGDVARMLMYMAVRYEKDDSVDLELNDKVSNGTAPYMGKLSTLLQWSKMDPPDAFEKHRNDVIFSIQGNRNPFIDHPEWVDLIWPAS